MTTSHSLGNPTEDSVPDISSCRGISTGHKNITLPEEAKKAVMEKIVEENKADIEKVSAYIKDSSKIDTIIYLLTKILETLSKE